VVLDDLVVIGKYLEDPKRPDGGKPSESFMIAIDRQTGEKKWRTARATDTTAYSTPAIRE
jgi:hypothetical protein